jgi:hypothetical protein
MGILFAICPLVELDSGRKMTAALLAAHGRMLKRYARL